MLCCFGRGKSSKAAAEVDHSANSTAKALTKEAALLETARAERTTTLKDLKPYVLDASIWELGRTALGVDPEQDPKLWEQQLADYLKVLREVKASGITSFIVASFTKDPATSINERWAAELDKRSIICNNCFAFADLTDQSVEDTMAAGPSKADLPGGMEKCKKYKIQNVILGFNYLDWADVPIEKLCQLVETRVGWASVSLQRTGSYKPPQVWLHIRDLAAAMEERAAGLEALVGALGRIQPSLRPRGLLFDDPDGTRFPFEVEDWTSTVRSAMEQNTWSSGHLLVHAAHGWGMGHANVLESLASGCTGLWAAVCDEGPGTGQAGSLITLCNLTALGNPYVKKTFNMPRMREAAINMTRITTGKDPHPRTEVYGVRALDICFDPNSMGGLDAVATVFGLAANTRISAMATTEMYQQRMAESFGDNGGAGWDEPTCQRMKELLHKDLLEGIKEEYSSPSAIAMLWERAGGKITPTMAKVLKLEKDASQHPLVVELKKYWDEWSSNQQDQVEAHKDQTSPKGALAHDSKRMTYASFYHAFMAAYFSCYTCDIATEAFRMFDVSEVGTVSWDDMMIRVKWALAMYEPLITDVTSLVQVVFEKLIVPEMHRRFCEAAPKHLRDGAQASDAPQKSNTVSTQAMYEEYKDERVVSKVVGVNVPVKGELLAHV